LDEPLLDEVPGREIHANTAKSNAGASAFAFASAFSAAGGADVDHGGLGDIVIALKGGGALPRVPDPSGGECPNEGEDAALLGRRSAPQRQRNVNVMSLVAITYFAVAGGPEGTETLIQTGGPLYSVIGFVVVGVLWSVPVALMSAELTTAFPENGGYVLWVSAAFGNQVLCVWWSKAGSALSRSWCTRLQIYAYRARSSSTCPLSLSPSLSPCALMRAPDGSGRAARAVGGGNGGLAAVRFEWRRRLHLPGAFPGVPRTGT